MRTSAQEWAGRSAESPVPPSLGPFEAVRQLAYDAPFPDLLRVRRLIDAPMEPDPAAAVRRELEPLRARMTPGSSVAVTAGSRGVADLATVVRAAGEWLREAGAEPFVVPAMGSHGGATAEGQLELLAALGVTEQAMGMPLRSSMETVELGTLPDGGPPVYMDKNAAAADAVLVLNRVKPHTDFTADVESGLAKLTAIGLGKQHGAEAIHAHGAAALGHWIPKAARRVVETGRILGGLGVVENAEERTARVAFVPPEGIGGQAEARLLAEARDLMGRIPFDQLDVLVVDEMGKDKSGAGLDTNVIGRMMIRDSAEFDRPNITNIVVRDLTDVSHGNATGVGLADFIPLRLLEKIDLQAMYINGITAGIAGVQRTQIPMVLPTDRDAVAAAILMCGRADRADARVARIASTMETEELLVSTSLREEAERHPALEVLGPAGPMAFDGAGALGPWAGAG